MSGAPPPALPPAFFARSAPELAPALVGCTLLHGGVGGRIVETEAYSADDPRSHSFRGKTLRNAVMFGPPGHLYVYFTYGMHFCANITCEEEGVGAAVLIRALEPRDGIACMVERRGLSELRLLCSGPARLAQALGIGREQNGLPVWREPLALLARGAGDEPRVVATPRIGVGGDPRPWRFAGAGSRFLSRPLPRALRA
jgi:DNA-3-methyladenine glycosylase